MKKLLAVAALCLLIGLFLFFRSNQTASISSAPVPGIEAATTRTAQSAAAGNALNGATNSVPAPSGPSPDQSQNLAARAGGFVPPAKTVADLPPDIVLRNVHRAVREYGQMFGGNPVGTNPEITAALSGKNPRGINFIDGQGGMRVNERGELVDQWGTPYFFHQLSGSEMEIHSAGPDKVMWTSDDLVTK